MSEVADQLARAARQEGLPLERQVLRHLLHGVLKRWSRSAQADAFLLRGGLMTQCWVGAQRRETRDVDFVGLYPRDLDDTSQRLHEILDTFVEDEVSFDLRTLQESVIWQETDFPGLRFVLKTQAVGSEMDLQIDVGFGDPIVPAAQWIDYPCVLGGAARVQAVRPELLVAWKLDGLFDHGARRWQAKDLYDLYLLTRHCSLDLALLVEGIRVAFEAHADPLEQVLEVVYSRDWWQKEASRSRWTKFRAASAVPVPEDLEHVAGTVARALRLALEQLIPFPQEGIWPGENG
jgi:hypothetical protein